MIRVRQLDDGNAEESQAGTQPSFPMTKTSPPFTLMGIFGPRCKLHPREGNADAQASGHVICCHPYDLTLEVLPTLPTPQTQDTQHQAHPTPATALQPPTLPNPTPSCYLAPIVSFPFRFSCQSPRCFLMPQPLMENTVQACRAG